MKYTRSKFEEAHWEWINYMFKDSGLKKKGYKRFVDKLYDNYYDLSFPKTIK